MNASGGGDGGTGARAATIVGILFGAGLGLLAWTATGIPAAAIPWAGHGYILAALYGLVSCPRGKAAGRASALAEAAALAGAGAAFLAIWMGMPQ